MRRPARWRWLAAGVAAGYCLALIQQHGLPGGTDDEHSSRPTVASTPLAPDRYKGPASATISLSVENPATGEFLRTPGLLVGTDQHLLTALAPIKSAQSAFLEYPGGNREPAGAVAAVDLELGLALLTTPFAGGIAFEPSRESGTLYLGREFNLVSAQAAGTGFVDSSARLTAAGHYVYALNFAGQRPAAPSALLDRNNGELIGVMLPSQDGADGDTLAVDAATVRDLLAKAGEAEAMPLAEFADYYFNDTVAGRRELLAAFIADGDFSSALLLARSIDLTGAPDGALLTLLEQAYRGEVEQALASGDTASALQTLDTARQQLGNSGARMALRAAVYRALDNSDEAIGWYLRALQIEPSLETALRPTLRDYVLSLTHRPSSSLTASIELINRVLGDDSEFAPYHARLGQLLFQSGRYTEADNALSRALALDPGLAGELGALRASARQKRNLPHSAEAPIDTRGNAIFVDVSINGAGPFRFLLDTGASYTAISIETALRLGIDNTFFGAPVTALETANGRIYATVTKLRSVALGQAVVNDVDVVILDTMSGADGLLGLSFLDHFNVDINHTVGRISLVRR